MRRPADCSQGWLRAHPEIALSRAGYCHWPAAHRVDTGGDRHQLATRHLRLRTAIAADDCRLRAADRLRQPGEPDAGARHGAPAADRRVSGAGCATQPSGAADAGREPGGVARRQCSGAAAFGLRLPRHAGDGADGHAIFAVLDVGFAACLRLRTGGGDSCGSHLWLRAGVDHIALRSHRSAYAAPAGQRATRRRGRRRRWSCCRRRCRWRCFRPPAC